ncbi:hypothetical protein HC928_06240 [bacterium]|nr:hypothetical protein [bacterium]
MTCEVLQTAAPVCVMQKGQTDETQTALATDGHYHNAHTTPTASIARTVKTSQRYHKTGRHAADAD